MFEAGDVLDNTYEILSRLGSGGGGIIYKAYHKRMKKPVAIKLIKDNVKGIIENRSEVDILKNLKNDYLPQVLDFICSGNNIYTVMEFIDGCNFKQLISDGNRFREKNVKKYALQLCDALEYLHNQNPPIIHSDIKPSNIMLTSADNICLIDFNISTISTEEGAYTVGASKGFAAPEQYKRIVKSIPVVDDGFHEETRFLTEDETCLLEDYENSIQRSTFSAKTKDINCAYIDIRTDIYGLGASLYYIATGRTPNSERPDFNGTTCSSGFRRIITKAMSPDPDKRYTNVSELKNALEKYDSKAKIIIPAASAALICTGLFVAVNALISGNNNAALPQSSTPDSTDNPPVTIASTSEEIPVTENTTTEITTTTTTTAETTTLSNTTTETSTTAKRRKIMPNLVGLTRDDAIKSCTSLGLSTIITYKEIDTDEENFVISQSLKPGTEIGNIISLEIVVSKKKAAVSETTVTTKPKPTVTYSTSPDPNFGWQHDESGYYYIDSDGMLLTGSSHINDDWYYFDDEGYAISGFYSPYGGTTHYLSEKGKILLKFQTINGYLYYFGMDGNMRTGWREIDGKIYYFDENGYALTGKHVIDSVSYVFSEAGILTSKKKPDSKDVTFEYTDKWFDTWKNGYNNKREISDALSSMYKNKDFDYFEYLYFWHKAQSL